LFRSLLGAAGAYTLMNASCDTPDNKQNESVEKSGAGDIMNFELDEFSIEQLQEKMQNKELTSVEITQLYLNRITQLDKTGPHLNAVIEINKDALAIAQSMDDERKSGKTRGLLHGIPVLIKDNINTADGMMTTAGSLALEGNIAAQDSFVAAKLRAAGAVILGKTNLSEWANFRSTRSSSGWSSRGGQTRNAYVTTHSPCGSSSGSGTAVAANMCAVAIGTETDGSIVCPSSINGIVGLKPTVGLVSRAGIIPISETQDTAGPMARTVRDAAILLGAIAGADPADPYTQVSENKAQVDYTQFLNTDALKGKRIGYDKSVLGVHEGIDATFGEALKVLEQKGATLVEIEFVNEINKISEVEYDVLMFEFKDGLNKYLAKANGKVKSLAELIEFNKSQADKVMPYFGQEILEASEKKDSMESAEYATLLKKLQTSRTLLNKLMKDNTLDAIFGPSNAPAWAIDIVTGDHFLFGFSTAAAITGYPTITVPSGIWKQLPMGVTFVTQPFTEAELLGMAYAYEQASMKRAKPEFKLTVF